jgi:hypothetical protein
MDHDDTRTVTVTQRLRPLRLAFLIERDSRRQALQAIGECCRIWGGALCPIVPVYRRTPKWARHRRADLTNGWLDAFESDALVEMTPGLASGTGYDARLVLSPRDLQTEPSLRLSAMTVWRAYAAAYQDVYRFNQRHPEDAVLCDPATPADALWIAAYFGLLEGRLREGYSYTFDPSPAVAGEGSFADLVLRTALTTPLAATTWGLKMKRVLDYRAIYYVFNPASVIDVLHMWSIRAYGLMIYPVPLPYLAAFRAGLDRVVRDGHEAQGEGSYPITVSPAPSISWQDVQRATDALTDRTAESPLLDPAPGHLIRLWEPAEMAERRLPRVEVTASESQADVILEHRHLTLTSPEPPLRGSPTVSEPNAWAVAVTVSENAYRSDLAQVYPPNLRDVTDLLIPTGPKDPVTATTEGLIARFGSYRRQHWWRIPTGTEMFIDWLGRRGIKARVSAAGKTTEELIRKLGGPHVAIHVGTPELVRLIGRAAASPSGVIGLPELQQVLGRQYKNQRIQMSNHIAFLAEKGVVQPVVSAACPRCSQRNWYTPAELENSLDCKRCSRPFMFPSSPPPAERNWGYRPIGPFAAPNFANGAYSVALAIRFFLFFGFMTGRQTWTTSLEGDRNGEIFEIDFGVWLQQNLDDGPPRLVIGEAKMFNAFEQEDFRRAERILREFPEATMVFATMRPEIEPRERTALVKLAKKGQGMPHYGRIVVLTAHELSDRDAISLDYGWTQQGGRAAEVADRHKHINTLFELSDATLDMYANWRWPRFAEGAGVIAGATA